MRGLYTIHDVENSSVNVWKEEGFVCFLICSPLDVGYINALKRNWAFFDEASGSSLWVLVSFVNDAEEMTDAEMRKSVKIAEKLGVPFSDAPCLLFAEGPESENFFSYKLKPGLDELDAGRTLIPVIDGCKKHIVTDKNGRTTHGFNALKQELRTHRSQRFLAMAIDATGQVLMAVLKKIATSGIG